LDKSTSGGGSTSGRRIASQKVSLFGDSDSGDEDHLFSSSSTSSHSRHSQGSGDFLAAAGDKRWPTAIPKKNLFNNEDLFGATKDEPGFDIFSTGANDMLKPNSLHEGKVHGNKDLFSGQLNDPEFDTLASSNTAVPITSQEKLKSDGKDTLFGADGGGDDSFDIFGGSINVKTTISKVQESVSSNSQSSSKDSKSIKPSLWGLFSDSGTEDVLDDIFAVPINKSQGEHLSSKATFVDSLFSGGSDLEDSTDNLFAGPVKVKRDNEDMLRTGAHLDKIDNLFSVPRTLSSNQDTGKNKVDSKDYATPNTVSVTETKSVRSDIFAEVPHETNNVVSSGLFSDLLDESGSDLFGRSTANASVNKKPVVANKPVISPKPKLLPVYKLPPLQDTALESDKFSFSKVNLDKNILQHSNSTDTKEGTDNLSHDTVPSVSQNVSAKSEQKLEIHTSLEGSTESMMAKGPSVQSSKLKPPKTLNIRKTTSLLFTSPSYEDDSFGMLLPEEKFSDLNTTEIIDQKPSNSSAVLPQSSSTAVANPASFSTEKSKSEKEISSKVDCSAGKT